MNRPEDEKLEELGMEISKHKAGSTGRMCAQARYWGFIDGAAHVRTSAEALVVITLTHYNELLDKLSAAEKERDGLRMEVKRLHEKYDLQYLVKDRDALKAKLAVAVEALEWYSNPNHWEWTTHESTRDGCGCTDLRIYKYPIQAPVQCGGKHAAEALKAIGGE